MSDRTQPTPGLIALLTPEELAALQAHGRTQRFPRGRQLLAEREIGDRVLLLVKGRVRVSSTTKAGRDAVLGFCGPGDLVGELPALDGLPRSGAITAVDAVEVLTVSDVEFRRWLTEHPRVAMVLLGVLSRRLRNADRKRVEFAAADTLTRVCSRLLELAERFGVPEGDTIAIDLPITQDELAGWCGASREATTRALHALRDLGWLQTHRRRLVVTDLAALAAHGV